MNVALSTQGNDVKPAYVQFDYDISYFETNSDELMV